MSERYDCLECKTSLFGQKYILKEKNMFCICCYEELFSNTCELCRLLISCTSKVAELVASNRPETGFVPLEGRLLIRVGVSAGRVLQRAPLAQPVLPVQQMPSLSGGAALRHQGRRPDMHGVLQQRVLGQVPRLHEDHHAR